MTTALSFWVLFLQGNPLHELQVFYERTFEIQAHRSSPFSLWDWGDYHAEGLPDLKWLQRVLQVALVGAALTLAVLPRRKSPLQLAAFTAVLLMGFELLLTHWTATYVVWFFPFVLLATLRRRTSSKRPRNHCRTTSRVPHSDLSQCEGQAGGVVLRQVGGKRFVRRTLVLAGALLVFALAGPSAVSPPAPEQRSRRTSRGLRGDDRLQRPHQPDGRPLRRPTGASSSPRRAGSSRSSTVPDTTPSLFTDLTDDGTPNNVLARTSTTSGTGGCSGWRSIRTSRRRPYVYVLYTLRRGDRRHRAALGYPRASRTAARPRPARPRTAASSAAASHACRPPATS